MTDSGSVRGRDVTDTAFYEWLLSDHPDARAERDWRRAATYQAETDRATAVRACVGKINSTPDAPAAMRDLAGAYPNSAVPTTTPNRRQAPGWSR